MATRDSEYLANQQIRRRAPTFQWAGLLLNDDGAWRLLAHYRHKCIHVFGVFGGAAVIFEGTNEDAALVTPTHVVTLKDATQADLAFTVDGMREVHENPLYVRPRLAGGDGTTDVTVLLVCRDGGMK